MRGDITDIEGVKPPIVTNLLPHYNRSLNAGLCYFSTIVTASFNFISSKAVYLVVLRDIFYMAYWSNGINHSSLPDNKLKQNKQQAYK